MPLFDTPPELSCRVPVAFCSLPLPVDYWVSGRCTRAYRGWRVSVSDGSFNSLRTIVVFGAGFDLTLNSSQYFVGDVPT